MTTLIVMSLINGEHDCQTNGGMKINVMYAIETKTLDVSKAEIQ